MNLFLLDANVVLVRAGKKTLATDFNIHLVENCADFCFSNPGIRSSFVLSTLCVRIPKVGIYYHAFQMQQQTNKKLHFSNICLSFSFLFISV